MGTPRAPRTASNINTISTSAISQAQVSLMFLQCNGNGVIVNDYGSTDCSGAGARHQQTVGSCQLSAGGGSFIDTCQSGFAKQANDTQTLPHDAKAPLPQKTSLV